MIRWLRSLFAWRVVLEKPATKVMAGRISGYWVGESRAPLPAPTYHEIDGEWWRSVSHWGPVLRTDILAA